MNRDLEVKIVRDSYIKIGIADPVDILVKETVDAMEEIVEYYNKSSKYEVAFGFTTFLMKKCMNIYDSYSGYLSSRNINHWGVYSVIGKRIEKYLE